MVPQLPTFDGFNMGPLGTASGGGGGAAVVVILLLFCDVALYESEAWREADGGKLVSASVLLVVALLLLFAELDVLLFVDDLGLAVLVCCCCCCC